MIEKENVLNALREVYDPEIPVNVVDLGLIYEIIIDGENVHLKMTLTAPGCPLSAMIANDAKEKVIQNTDAKNVVVEFVWEPKWTPDMMTEEAKKNLGFA